MEVYLDNNSTTQMDPKVQEVFCDNIKKFGISMLFITKV